MPPRLPVFSARSARVDEPARADVGASVRPVPPQARQAPRRIDQPADEPEQGPEQDPPPDEPRRVADGVRSERPAASAVSEDRAHQGQLRGRWPSCLAISQGRPGKGPGRDRFDSDARGAPELTPATCIQA